VIEVPIDTNMIRLGPLLKLAGVGESGGDTKALIAEGGVYVNGERETRRGRQLFPGDLVEADGEEIRVT
jgi:ribosome-associated protein